MNSVLSGNQCLLALGIAATLAVAPAQEIEVYRAKEVKPVRPAAAARPAAPPESQAAPPAYRRGLSNPVEPLSNGLRLASTRADIVNRFGEPTQRTFDSRTFGYESFKVQVGGAREEIWRVRLTGTGVSLSSGIRVGSRNSDVQDVFGSVLDARAGQYRLRFSYDGDRVREILIEPANGSFAPAGPGPQTGGPAQPPQRSGKTQSSVVGVWQFIVPNSTLGSIELKADGTYVGRPTGGGAWRVEGRDLQFTGSLTFNHGRGKLNEDGTLIEFHYTHEKYGPQYFVLKKQ